MSVFVAARTLGELSGWRLTNVEMQKILYFAHMLHLGRTGTPLVDETFEAWDYGPVLRSLYRYARDHKKGQPIPAFDHVPCFEIGTVEHSSLDDAYSFTRHLSPGELITLTHRPKGAWDRHYKPEVRNLPIPNHEIQLEFHSHITASDDAVSWAEKMADEVADSPSRYLEDERKRAFRARLLQGYLQ